MLSFAAASSTAFAAPSKMSLKPVRAQLRMQEVAPVEEAAPVEPPFDPVAFAKTLPGITAPLGFFDPAGFCSPDGASNEKVTEGKVRFYREVELKHCRIAMLAALGCAQVIEGVDVTSDEAVAGLPARITGGATH